MYCALADAEDVAGVPAMYPATLPAALTGVLLVQDTKE